MVNRVWVWLRSRGRRCRAANQLVIGVPFPEWTEGDRDWLAGILRDARGKRLMAVLYLRLQNRAFSTVERSVFEVGKSAGMSEFIGYLEALAEGEGDS